MSASFDQESFKLIVEISEMSQGQHINADPLVLTNHTDFTW